MTEYVDIIDNLGKIINTMSREDAVFTVFVARKL